MSDCIFYETCEGGKSGKRISGEQQTAKISTACQSLEKTERQHKRKKVKKETANEACFNKGIDGVAGKDVL